MKKVIYTAAGFLVLIMAAVLLYIMKGDERIHPAEASSYYGSDSNIPSFPENENQRKGTKENPFIILEIIPYEGYAEIGCMINGCEPVPVNDDTGDILVSMGGFTRVAENNRNYYKSKNLFLKNVLNLEESECENYQIHVVTITPDILNKPENYKLIRRADLIYISPKTHYGKNSGTIVGKWEYYHPEKKIENNPANFYTNDLTWETAVELLKKSAIDDDPAPIIFDAETFSVDESYSHKGIDTIKHYSDGKTVKVNATGYTSNTAKLYLIMQQMEPDKFYYNYISTNKVISVKVKDAGTKQISKNGIDMTTGCYIDLDEGSKARTQGYRLKTEDDSTVWSIRTFLPYEKFADEAALNGGRAFEELGYRLFTDKEDGLNSHTSIRHGIFVYNGDNAITQELNNNRVIPKENYYNIEAFDFYQAETGTRPDSLTPALAIRYLLFRYGKTKLRILEIEPCNDFIWNGTTDFWDSRKTSSQDSGNGSDAARKYFAKFFPRYHGKVKVTRMTSCEFIGKIEDLNSNYDLIFFGLKSGMLHKDAGGTATVYNDTTLNGKIYLHVGDTVKEPSLLRGTLGSDDILDTYRYSGNDITAAKLKELISFMNAGNPVILGEGFLKKDSVNTDKIDTASYIKKLADLSSDRLFFEDNLLADQSKLYQLENILAASKCRIVFGNTEGTLVKEDCYPVVYKDNTAESSLGDGDIYINGKNISNRTLQYKFYIEDGVGSNKTYEVNLLIDMNADGKFDEDAENAGNLTIMRSDGNAAAQDSLKAGVNYSLTRNLEESYFGVLPWKLEIKERTNPDNNYGVINYCAIKNSDEDKIHLNVLQIMSDHDNTIDLSKHKLFAKYTANLNDYVLNIKSITVSDFESRCGYTDYKYILEDDNETKSIDRNSTYDFDNDKDGFLAADLLILGFADLYSDINNKNARDNIEEFINRGKTVLFTHDTTSLCNMSKESYTGTDYWGYHLNQQFRDKLGMDRFGATGNKNDKDSYTFQDNCRQGYTDTVLNQYAKAGQRLNNINFPDDPKNRIINEEYVTSENQGQLTVYPYKIENRFQVALTHGQYYQLNLERDDMTVWYCLSDSKADSQGKGTGIYSTTPNDARNNYYIYNKGNITYSGVGHCAISEREDDTGAVMETKLFINTMIAAYKTTIKEPEINITNSNKSTDAYGMDYIYVDYDIYSTEKAYGSDVDKTSGQKVGFRVLDNNLLYNKKLTVQFFTRNSEANHLEKLNLAVYDKSGKEVTNRWNQGTEIKSATDYFMCVPLDDLNQRNKKDPVIIRVTLSYGKNYANKVTTDKSFTLVRRGLFDLD